MGRVTTRPTWKAARTPSTPSVLTISIKNSEKLKLPELSMSTCEGLSTFLFARKVIPKLKRFTVQNQLTNPFLYQWFFWQIFHMLWGHRQITLQARGHPHSHLNRKLCKVVNLYFPNGKSFNFPCLEWISRKILTFEIIFWGFTRSILKARSTM